MLKNNGFHNRHSPILRAFSPLSLFSGGAPGTWYDPSDFTTLFQDSAGTTPVTAVEQPVGLMLDKSQGLVLGPELVPATYIVTTSGSWAASAATITRNGSATGQITLALNTLSTSKRYQVSFTVSNISGDTFGFRLAGGTAYNITANGTYTFRVVAGGVSGPIFLPWGGTAGQATITNISVKELPGNHAFQSTSASRPVLKIDGNGKYYMLFNGSDSSFLTNSINFTSTDKMSVFVGVRKLSDAARGMVAELSATSASNNGTFGLTAPNAASATYAFESKGTVLTDAVGTPFAAPLTSVLSGLSEISTDSNILRINGVQADSDTGDQGTGNYGNYALYIGRRGGSSLPFNGQMYSMIIVGKAVTADELSSTETYVATKTGVTL